jgi:hypothetical protein
MDAFHDERERRIGQFCHHLELMRQRRRELVRGNCFIVFNEQCDTDGSDGEQLTESKAKVLVRESANEHVAWENGLGATGLDEIVPIELPDEGWRGDDSQRRFIQFSFNRRYFDIDIPNTTLYRAEAEIILRRRPGFFYVTERRQFEHPEEKADEFNPVRKVYVYGDERSAAEDMAYVWFDVWMFPVDWRFYVRAAAFVEKKNWERDFPIA